MEFELTIRGTQEELARVLAAISGLPQTGATRREPAESPAGEGFRDYLAGLSTTGRHTLKRIVESSTGSGDGISDRELLHEISRMDSMKTTLQHVWGEVGGIGRRWVARFGTPSPFKKDHAGRYRLSPDLARQISELMEYSS
jgi:hypothetical protein